MPEPGVVTDDGRHVVLAFGDTVSRRRSDGTLESSVILPDGWGIITTDSMSADGRRIGVSAMRASDSAALLIDLQTGSVTKLDQPLTSGDDRASTSGGAVVTDDGHSVAFTFIDGPVGCQGCSNVWLRSGDDLELVNVTAAGGRPATGHSELHDVSGDGRYVLFESSSSDLAGAVTPGTHLYRRDMITGQIIPVAFATSIGSGSRATISDDGRRIAAISSIQSGPYEIEVVAVYDLMAGATTVLTNDGHPSRYLDEPVAMSADGRTVAYSTFTIHEGPRAAVAHLPE